MKWLRNLVLVLKHCNGRIIQVSYQLDGHHPINDIIQKTNILTIWGCRSKKKSYRKVVAYARVSSRNQKDDLRNQIDFIRTFVTARGIILDECIEDIGSGLNYNRSKWNELLQAVMRDEIATIYITYKDRFIRFGFEWFENLCKQHQTEIVVLNHEETSPDKELVEDLTSIVHVFSCRLYGLRKYKKTLKEDKEVLNREIKCSSSAISKQDHANGS